MVEDFQGIEAGDLIEAFKTVFVVDAGIDSLTTLWEGNTTVYRKGTIALVVETIFLKNDRETPVLNVLIKEQLVSVLCFGFKIIRKNGGISGQ